MVTTLRGLDILNKKYMHAKYTMLVDYITINHTYQLPTQALQVVLTEPLGGVTLLIHMCAKKIWHKYNNIKT